MRRRASLWLAALLAAYFALPVVVTWAVAPTATTGTPTAVTTDAATLHATIDPNGRPTTYHFEYGPTTAYGSRTPDASAGSGSDASDVATTIRGLSPGTRYHVRVVADNADGQALGADRSFVTATLPAPGATTLSASEVGPESARLRGTVDPNGQPTTYHFEYGPTAGYGSRTTETSAASGADPVAVSMLVRGLRADTTYHVRIVATSAGGETRSADRTFATPRYPAPRASTAAADGISATSARLRGTINPREWPTTHHFEYGPTQMYGSRTSESAVQSGTADLPVTAAVSGLAANTTYHFRVVATGPGGVTRGGDRTFKTRRVPLGLSITVTPNPVVFGAATTVNGQLGGTGNAGVRVRLQQRAFPYRAGFQDIGPTVVTGRDGGFSFAALTLALSSQLRVVTADRKVASPVTAVAVAVRIRTDVSRRRVKRHRRVRFSGTVRPARDGAAYAIQKLNTRGVWVTVAGGLLRHRDVAFSRFSRRIRVPRSGRYRVFVRITDGNYTSNSGRAVHIITHR